MAAASCRASRVVFSLISLTMMTMNRRYSSEIAKLVDLESFDPRAFLAADKPTQACCDFVLALALVFNDIKGVLLGDSLLLGETPKDRVTPTTELGAFAGSHLQAFRILLGVVHELLYLVKAEKTTRESPCFKGVVRNLPKATRTAWEKLVQASEADVSSDEDVRFLVIARNTVAYHYGTKAIGRGFRRAFGSLSERPFLSRGSSISTTRFYFADRAAQSSLQLTFGEDDLENYFLKKNPELIEGIAFALFTIVTGFITSRGCSWRNGVI